MHKTIEVGGQRYIATRVESEELEWQIAIFGAYWLLGYRNGSIQEKIQLPEGNYEIIGKVINLKEEQWFFEGIEHNLSDNDLIIKIIE